MSVRPSTKPLSTALIPRKKVTIETLHELRRSKTPITMLTAYDYPSALACSSSHLTDITLVGDSLAQVCLGYESTTQLTLSEMVHHTRAVARGTTHPFLVADMPFGSYHTSIDNAVMNAVKLVQEGRVEAVKLEGGQEIVSVVRRLTDIGIPVMAHVGLLPQRHSAMSGYKVQGRSAEGAKKVVTDALALEEAGAFAVVVEAVPRELGKYVTDRLKVPTIGIGAGPWTSGQVLVYDDVMGTWSGHKAKFVRRFANMKEARDMGVHNYAEAVRTGTFPDPETESYTADQTQWARFMENERVEGDSHGQNSNL
ncbi:ketopantoate hydroxymethyltransferase [Phlegmacium glaucopus]|nr:ketopantoate hydroxymethyltransferase [Phlegmacium glaucopus]